MEKGKTRSLQYFHTESTGEAGKKGELPRDMPQVFGCPWMKEGKVCGEF